MLALFALDPVDGINSSADTESFARFSALMSLIGCFTSVTSGSGAIGVIIVDASSGLSLTDFPVATG